jgi:hypothetical protein
MYASPKGERMKVHQLIEILDELDSDGEVFLVVGERWPFEHYVHGVAIREDVVGEDADPNEEAPEPPRDRWTAGQSTLPRNDVLIVAGSQARYGDPDTWGAARRA